MPTFINEMYDDRGGIKEFMGSLVFFMRVGLDDDQPYNVEVTMERVSPLRVKIKVGPCYCALEKSEIKCVLSVDELGIPFDLPIKKFDQNMLAKITKYENMKGEKQRRRYRKKCSTFIRKWSKLECIKEALNYVHTQIYVIKDRALTKAVYVKW